MRPRGRRALHLEHLAGVAIGIATEAPERMQQPRVDATVVVDVVAHMKGHDLADEHEVLILAALTPNRDALADPTLERDRRLSNPRWRDNPRRCTALRLGLRALMVATTASLATGKATAPF